MVLDDFQRREGWRPVEHTVAEVEEFNAYIESITDLEKNQVNRYFSWKKQPTAERMKFIRRWVRNEQFMSFASASYFITRYGYIRAADESVTRFEYRTGQKIFHNLLAEYDDKQVGIKLFCLKARQVGLSTCVALYFLHRILFRANTHAVMASVQVQQSEKLSKMIWTTWEKLPFWLPPPQMSTKAKEPTWANGSVLSVQAGAQQVGIAQGSTPTAVHISEVADYQNPKRVLDEGLFPALHLTPSMFAVIEGTGSTAKPWQREKWKYYSENWGKGGEFQPFFIPPSCASDLYPPDDWIRAHPIPKDWRPMAATERMRVRAEMFIRQTPYLSKAMGKMWFMPREFMYFWEAKWREAVASHTEKTFLAQYAPTPDDAFQSKNDRVFPTEIITGAEKDRVRGYQAYAITGKSIMVGTEGTRYEPPTHDVDYGEARIQLHWEDPSGEHNYRWELVPLLPFDDSTDERCFDKLLVFAPPVSGADYSIGIDTAHGLNTPNEDRSTLSVHIVRSGAERDEQVASFTSLRTNSAQMSRIAAAVATLYGTDGDSLGAFTTADPMGPKFCIEQVRKAGDECLVGLKNMGFFNHHVMHQYDEKGVIDPNKGTKEGWRTSGWSRPILLGKFVEAVSSGWLKLNDPICIRQLDTFVRKEQGSGNKEASMDHEDGAHDDNIFAAAQAFLTAHDMENMAVRFQLRYTPKVVRVEANLDAWASNGVRVW